MVSKQLTLHSTNWPTLPSQVHAWCHSSHCEWQHSPIWRHVCGTAMGTSAAVNCANFCVGILELTVILDKCQDCLLFYGRFIDDGTGALDHRQPHSDLAWHQFLADFNSCGVLEWTDTGMVNKLIFLDFVAEMDPLTRFLKFTSHSKDSNLCPHIQPNQPINQWCCKVWQWAACFVSVKLTVTQKTSWQQLRISTSVWNATAASG